MTPQEFLEGLTKDTDGKVLIGLISILVLLLISWIIVSSYKDEKQTQDFIRREIGGVLLESKDAERGVYYFTIKQHLSGEELSYYLYVSNFFEENNIQKGDSIAKEANSHTVSFFKKHQGTFKKCCDLYYY